MSPGPNYIKLVRVRISFIFSPGLDFIKVVQMVGSSPDFRVRIRILSIESVSESEFCPFSSPASGPDFIRYVLVRVRNRFQVLPTPSCCHFRAVQICSSPLQLCWHCLGEHADQMNWKELLALLSFSFCVSVIFFKQHPPFFY